MEAGGVVTPSTHRPPECDEPGAGAIGATLALPRRALLNSCSIAIYFAAIQSLAALAYNRGGDDL